MAVEVTAEGMNHNIEIRCPGVPGVTMVIEVRGILTRDEQGYYLSIGFQKAFYARYSAAIHSSHPESSQSRDYRDQ